MKIRRLLPAAPFAACLALGLALAQAQVLPPSARGEKRPPPPPTATMGSQQIPAGADAGTPATSKGADIGITTNARTREEMRGIKGESAAARAAARKTGGGISAVDEAIASGPTAGKVTPPKLTADGSLAPPPKRTAPSPAQSPKASSPSR